MFTSKVVPCGTRERQRPAVNDEGGLSGWKYLQLMFFTMFYLIILLSVLLCAFNECRSTEGWFPPISLVIHSTWPKDDSTFIHNSTSRLPSLSILNHRRHSSSGNRTSLGLLPTAVIFFNCCRLLPTAVIFVNCCHLLSSAVNCCRLLSTVTVVNCCRLLCFRSAVSGFCFFQEGQTNDVFTKADFIYGCSLSLTAPHLTVWL